MGAWLLLHLNRSDLISSGYIDYFESDIHTFQSKGSHSMSQSAAPFLKKLLKLDASAQHLIPSANLVISQSTSPRIRLPFMHIRKRVITLESHSLKQWQNNKLDVEHKPFKGYELQVGELDFVGTCQVPEIQVSCTIRTSLASHSRSVIP
jgi:hypothetical protein